MSAKVSVTVSTAHEYMHIRTLLGCLLLSLAVLAFTEAVVDAAAYHVSVRQQWRSQHQSSVRASQRKPPGVLGDVPELSVPSVFGPVPVSDRPEFLPPLPTPVFVPPRV